MHFGDVILALDLVKIRLCVNRRVLRVIIFFKDFIHFPVVINIVVADKALFNRVTAADQKAFAVERRHFGSKPRKRFAKA